MGQQFSGEEAQENGVLDVAELQEWYRKFLEECPSGTLFLHEFKSFFKVAGNEEASQYVEGMFRAFDKNGVRRPEGEDGWLRSHPGAKGAPSVGAQFPSSPALPLLFVSLHPLSPFLSHCFPKLFSPSFLFPSSLPPIHLSALM